MIFFRKTCVKLKAKSIILAALVLLSFINVNAQPVQTDVPALKDVYKNDFYIGCLLSYTHVGFADDVYVPGQTNPINTTTSGGGYLIRHHMNSMSPGNNMKPQYTVDLAASAAAYNSATDKDYADTHPVVKFNGNLIAQLNWAKKQGFTFRGHTLVWHSQTPGTAFFRTGFAANGARLSKEKMTERMENYIKEVIRLIHEGWPGLLSAIDVVNEAVNDNGTDRSSNNEWYETFGDVSFIMKAFEFTRKYTVEYGETQIKLYYNDYNTHNSAKADGIVRICKPIYDAGYLDGIGMQDHDQYNSPTAAQWIASYNKFYPICTEMAVTELDVKPSTSSNSLTTQANQYAQLFKCFVERSYKSGRGKIISVSKDGLNDQYAFVANASLWDNKNQCKPAFYAVVDVGIYYSKLDSLITYSGTLNESEYTQESWQNFTSTLTSAQTVMVQNYSYNVSAADALKNESDNLDTAIKALVKINTGIAGSENIPNDYKLEQNYPNPFNPETTISYQLPVSGYVSLKVYDILGNEVATLVDGFRNAGNYKVVFDASHSERSRGMASGVYFYRLSSSNNVQTKKLMFLK